MKQSVLFALLGSLFLYSFGLQVWPPQIPIEVEVTARGEPDHYSILYDSGSGYTEMNSIIVPFQGGDSAHTISAELPPVSLRKVRIEPGTRAGTVFIEQICLRQQESPLQELCWSGEALAANFRPRRGIAAFDTEEGGLRIKVADGWPYFESNPELDQELLRFSKRSRWPIALTALFGGIVLFLLQELLRRRGDSASQKVRSFSALRLLLFAASTSALLFTFLASLSLGRITPVFQGPDETAHTSKFLSFIGETSCGSAPRELKRLERQVHHLPYRREAKLTSSEVERLHSINNKSKGGDADFPRNACDYNNGYLLLPTLFNTVRGITLEEEKPIHYTQKTRESFTLAAILLWLPSFLLALFGKPLYPGISAPSVRAAALLSTVYMLTLPQTIWLSSVIGQDSSLIALGHFVLLSVFLRVPLLSDLTLLLALFFGASKVIYLLPWGTAVLLHYGTPYLTRSDPCAKRAATSSLQLLAAALFFGVLGYFVIYAALDSICGDRFCYELNESALFQDSEKFLHRVQIMFTQFGTMLLPHTFHVHSAFGTFGWLDTPLPLHLQHLFTAPILAASALAFIPALFALKQSWRLLFPAVQSVLYWGASLLALYLSFEVMQIWCGPGELFGCGYQHRYALPVYSVVPFLLFLFVTTTASHWRRCSAPAITCAALLGAQGYAAYVHVEASKQILSDRYYRNEEIRNRYLKALDPSTHTEDAQEEA